MRQRDRLMGICLVAVCAGVIAWLCVGREYFNIWTESDFLGGFLPDAQRYQRGEPMEVKFHPPAYSILVATVQSRLGDWLVSGLLISWVSAAITLLASLLFFWRTGGAWAGLGAVVGLGSSSVFLAYSAQATSDVFFTALWMAALAMTAAALDRGGRGRWLVVGLLAGAAVVTRTNGIALGVVVLGPFLSAPIRHAWQNASAAVAGLLVPIALWAAVAGVTGSPFLPTKAYANLALTYFTDGNRISGTYRIAMEEKFQSTWQVLAHDPGRMITIYVRDLLVLPRRVLRTLMWMPLAALGMAAAIAWLLRWRDPKVQILGLGVVASVLLINMKAFEARFFLFLVPILGASVGLAASDLLERTSARRRIRIVVACALLLLPAISIPAAAVQAVGRTEDPLLRAQLDEAVPETKRVTPENATVLTISYNFIFHAERRESGLPRLTSLADLKALLEAKDGAVYVFIGMPERKYRPELASLLLEDPLPGWLAVAAQGERGDTWRLVRFVRPGVPPSASGEHPR